MRTSILSALVLSLTVLLLAVTVTPAAAQSQIVIVPGAGLADATAAAPVGGNPGTTVGAQRTNVFLRAADIWSRMLTSTVPVRVQAQFVPQFCNSFSATLGSAGPITIVGNFAGAVVPNTWYHVALGNAQAGVDLAPTANDISASFNSNLNGNPACLGGNQWYYGLDNNPPPGDIDFLGVILHELAHGLGFSTVVGPPSWTAPSPLPNDIWSYFLFDATLGVNWTALTPAGKQFSATNTGNLTWSGANVTAAATGVLTSGINAATGFVQMYAPSTYSGGSSVSHFDTAVFPNELMEPFFTNPTNKVGLAQPLFQDIGWTTTPQNYVMYSPIPGPAGNNNLFSAGNGTAGNTTFLLYGFTPGGVAIPGCGAATTGMADVNILASGPTAANGNFDFQVNIGSGLAGLTVLLQAVELPSCKVSPLLTHTF